MYRYLNQKTLYIGRYHFTYTLTDTIQRQLFQIGQQLGGILGSNTGLAESDKNKFMVRSIIEEAISSSQMEGSNTTRKRAREILEKGLKPAQKAERMIVNNYAAMQHVLQLKNTPFSPENIAAIQQIVTAQTLKYSEDEGRYRTAGDDVWVEDGITKEEIYIPPPAEEVPLLMQALCDFANEDGESFIHPIIKAIIIHFLIGWIHPFVDGNGRTARSLFYWYMLKSGFWLTEHLAISSIIQASKCQYEKAYLYTETDNNDIGYFIQYHMQTLEKAVQAMQAYISRKQQEVTQAAQFLRISGIKERMAHVLKMLHDDPDRTFTPVQMQNRFGITANTARADLGTLTEKGFLEKIPLHKKKFHYARAKSFEAKIREALRG